MLAKYAIVNTGLISTHSSDAIRVHNLSVLLECQIDQDKFQVNLKITINFIDNFFKRVKVIECLGLL